jgi:hypothetical protein
MKIIEQPGFAHRRRRRTRNGSDRNSAAFDQVPQGRAQPAQGPGVRQFSRRHARCLGPPPGRRAAILRQEVVPRRRSGRRAGIDEIHRDNGLADHHETAAARTGRGTGIIDIRDFDERHEFFETFCLLPRH